MFSAFSKLVSFVYQHDDDDDEDDPPDVDQTVEVPALKEHSKLTDIKHNSSKPDLVKSFIGKVTHVFEKHGLINGDIYFSFDTIVNDVIPEVGDDVDVIARQKEVGDLLIPEQVSVLQESWDTNSDNDNQESEVLPNDGIVGKITSFNGKDGLVNGHITFVREDLCGDFTPCVGDYVKAEFQKDQSIKGIVPLRFMERESKITCFQGDHGYLDGEIFFYPDACEDGYKPFKWDKVMVKAIESAQGRCNWRAVSIKPWKMPVVSQFVFRTIAGPTQQSFAQDLLKNKYGIYVEGPTDVGQVKVGQQKKLTIWVHNKGTSPQTLQKCHIPTESSQFSIDSVKFLQEYPTMMKKGNSDVTNEDVVLYPSMSVYINVALNPRSHGAEKQLLVVVFDGFKIGRYLTAEIIDPYVSMINTSNNYTSSRSDAMNRYRSTAARGSDTWRIAGQKPASMSNSKSGKRNYLPNKLKQYTIPTPLRDCVLDGEDLRELYPVLSEELSMENYRLKFDLLLHLEEIQMEIDIREFDLDRVCMRRVGEYLGLKVPGLAEGRPSVLIGDKILLTDPVDPEGPFYEGYVHEILKDEVLVKCNKNFQDTYSGKDYNVQFTFNRAPIRRCHQSAEFVIQLGENVLFPSVLMPKMSQVRFLPQSAYIKPVNTKTSRKLERGGQFYNKRLNVRQQAAVTRILEGQSRPVPYILFGPPGTGKTVTVVESILQILQQIPSSRVLACTPSNSAADLIAERLHESGQVKTTDMVRLNAIQRNQETIPDCLKPYCVVGEDLETASYYRIVVCTCVSAGVLYSLGIKAGHFTHVIVDEAGQATEPECLIAACLIGDNAGQIVLAGDPMQLGPVLRSKHAKEYGLELSFLERLMTRSLYARNETMFVDHGCYDPLLVTKLIDNYRSHPAILGLSSDLFYHNELVVKADEGLTHQLCNWSMLPHKGFPVIFHGVRGEDVREGNSPSWFNPVETVQVIRYLQGLLNDPEKKVKPEDIGIITPYRKQVEKIRLLIDKLGMASIKIGSVEEFQGQERHVIIISTVRSNEKMIGFDQKHTLGFLSNPKRFNVAITRAQALLIIIGNPYVLIEDQYWKSLIQYCIENKSYTGCSIPGYNEELYQEPYVDGDNLAINDQESIVDNPG